MSTKALSELPKLSANLSAFDLPVHHGDADAMRELARITFQTATPNGISARALLAPAEPNLTLVGSLSRRGDHTALLELATQPVGGLLKRAFDIALAGVTLVLVAPLMLTVALLIYVTMGRPIFFSQMRMGFRGTSFPCMKFRTMVTDADVALGAYLKNNPAAASEWEERRKLEHDPRITRLGRLLRQSSLDELPQLINVLKGDMSCVGPRPIVAPEIVRYGRYWKEYMRSRPGLTGAWQVSGRNRIDYKTRVALDRSYVRRWSLWRDLAIIVRTIPAIMRFDDTT